MVDHSAIEDDLYPEITSAGSLAAALAIIAAEMAVDLGEVAQGDADPHRWALIASKSPARRAMGVGIGAVERWFLLGAWSRGVQLLSGKTQDLRDVVRAASAWREGLPLQEIQQAASFVDIGDLAYAHERGPADAVDLKWHRLREMAVAESPEWLLPLVEAAAAEPKVRQLFPYTSHQALLFSSCTGYPYSQELPMVEPLEGNGYRVLAADGRSTIGDVGSGVEAVALVLTALPGNLGPAVAGCADELEG